MLFFHSRGSQGQYIRRLDHIRDAIIDQIGDAIRPRDPYEPLVQAHLPPDPPPAPPGEKAREVEAVYTDARLAEEDIAYIEEMQRPYCPWNQRQHNIADKAAMQCRGDIGVYTNGSPRLLVDVAVGDATNCTLLPQAPAATR